MSILVKTQKKIRSDYFLTITLIVNYGKSGGQEIPHIHIHMLGGRLFGWPPG